MTSAAQIAHVELLTPRLDESVAFFTELLGMQVSDRDADRCYLRCYEDRYHHSLKLTAADEPALGHIGVRVASEDEVRRIAAPLERRGEGSWTDGDLGHGPAFLATAPTGHRFEVFHEVEPCTVPDGERSRVLNRPQRRPAHGVPVRRIDHVNVMAGDVAGFKDWVQETLPFRLREQAVRPDGTQLGAWLSSSSLMHDLAAVVDASDRPGRLHHVGFWYGAPQHLWDIADLLIDRDVVVEHGPGKHGVTQSMYLYVFEPGGNRIELFGDVGQLVFDPDWEPVTWVDDGSSTTRSTWIGNPPPASFHTYGTPPVEDDQPATAATAHAGSWVH
jgi:catechol 2,3-dioxygenase